MKEDSQNKPLISVIIPCYKVEKYLDRCMRSVINQTYQNIEIILVDDGSPDNTGQMCDKWAEKDPRIKVIHKQNEGLGFARNSGLDYASGDWIAFVDSDDYIENSMYSKLMDIALINDCDIAFCGHIKQMSDGSEMIVNDFREQRIFEKEKLLELSRGFFQPITEAPNMLTMSVWHGIYRRSIIKNKFYSEREVGSEDIHFQICAVINAKRIIFIPETLYVYCYNGDSLSHTFIPEKYNRYKYLAKIIASTYKRLGAQYRFDYYVFVLAFVSIRQIICSNATLNEKIDYIKYVTCDSFWDNCKIEDIVLDIPKRIFLFNLKGKHYHAMLAMAWLYHKFHYQLRKKAIQ